MRIRTRDQRLFDPGPKRILALDGGGVQVILTPQYLKLGGALTANPRTGLVHLPTPCRRVILRSNHQVHSPVGTHSPGQSF
jgi:hypothetical protein